MYVIRVVNPVDIGVQSNIARHETIWECFVWLVEHAGRNIEIVNPIELDQFDCVIDNKIYSVSRE